MLRSLPLPLPLYLVALLSLPLYVTGVDVRITTAQDLIDLSEKVLLGTTYAGTTIFLESDIDFSKLSGNFKPIGDESNDFRGVFDGQGYKISNLKLNSGSFRHAGFIGYSQGGLAVRNLVLDGTCSFSSSKDTTGKSNTFSGGIIGCCDATYGPCTSENNVNMAAVSFTGASGWNMFLGGIVGQFFPDGSNEVIIRNCANYGAVTFSGSNSHYGHIGGIAGELSESDFFAETKKIQNCINYGTITSSGTDGNRPYVDGIIGISSKLAIENCVNVGQIEITQGTDAYAGCIAGFVRSDIEINYCHWISGTGYTESIWSKDFAAIIASKGSYEFTIYAASVSALNSYEGWNKWVYNTNSASITFHTNGGGGYTIASQKLILLPSLVEGSSGLTFSGWYTDITCTNKLDSDIITTYGGVDLYGGWKYTVSFNGNGGVTSQASKDVVYGQHYGALPGAVRTGYTLLGWYTASSGGEEVESNSKVTITGSQTLYAQWAANTYTVTFNGNNGISSQSTKNVTYDEPYGDLGTATRTGYTFLGWYTDITGGDLIESDTNVTITSGQTLYAHWMTNNYTVTFKIDNKTTIERVLQFNTTIEYPKNPEKEGFMFAGWDKTIEHIPANNITINALWNETTQFVEIVFNTKDMSKEQIEKIIEEYVGTDFTIVEYENKPGETRVIVKFNDVETAKNFIETVKSDQNEINIKMVGFLSEYAYSYSFIVCPGFIRNLFTL